MCLQNSGLRSISMDDRATCPKVKVMREQEKHFQTETAPKVKRDGQIGDGRGLKLVNVVSGCVLRPRAVLSSPDNDDMIGNINKSLASKQPTSLQNTPTKATLCSKKASPNNSCKNGRSLALKRTPKLATNSPKAPLSNCKANNEVPTKKLSHAGNLTRNNYESARKMPPKITYMVSRDDKQIFESLSCQSKVALERTPSRVEAKHGKIPKNDGPYIREITKNE